jgi:hypothetical protein
MRVLRLALLLCLLPAVAVATPGAAPALTVPTLVGIRAAHHPTHDRVVFEFRGGPPGSTQVRYVDRLIGDASGLPVRVPGRAILRVRFEPARAHDASGRTAPLRRAFALPNLMAAVRSGDFEAVTTYGLGLARRTPFHVTSLRRPARVVVDVRAAFRTANRGVYFLDRGRFRANTEPFFVSRARPVPTGTPATGLMDRLFAGPLPAEQADGLRLLRSRATGWTRLRIDGRVARVQLTGGCSSGGSTVTIAGEIMPTLRQLDSVRWVKIYDPKGRTEAPTGRRDSIPECLEP